MSLPNPDGGKVSIEKDPCTMESKESMKCLDDNNYDRKKCEKYFDNYKACKKFWWSVGLARSRSGVSPSLPPLHERDAIKKHYIKTGKIVGTPPPPEEAAGGGGS